MRWKNKPEGANWGAFGDDDQLGRPNLIGSQQVLNGAREIRSGLSFCLSLPLDFPVTVSPDSTVTVGTLSGQFASTTTATSNFSAFGLQHFSRRR